MRPTLVLRIHPSPVLIPKMYSGMTLRHPSDAYKHAFWDETRRLEYEGLWKKGEWTEVPEGSVKIDMVRFSPILSRQPTTQYHNPFLPIVNPSQHTLDISSSFRLPSLNPIPMSSSSLAFSRQVEPYPTYLSLYISLQHVAELTTRNPESKL
jgi:hypothetical protein